MQAAPEVFDLGQETAETLSLYGAESGDNKSFAAQCLVARRLLERGQAVRVLVRRESDPRPLQGLDVERVWGDVRDFVLDLEHAGRTT